MRLFHYLSVCTVLLALLSGCGKNRVPTDAEEEKNPLVQQGHAYMDAHDYAKAETAFKQAIKENPLMARPYLDLAIIYQQYKPSYIDSICCYKHYLLLRPETEKREFINEQITKVQTQLAQAILRQSGATQAIQELGRLRQENATLRKELAARPRQVQAPKPEPAQAEPPAAKKSVTQTIPKSAKPANTSETKHKIYTVRSGDTLTKIARKFYGTSNYAPIYEANKDRMKSPGDLRVGQTLVIPMPAK